MKRFYLKKLSVKRNLIIRACKSNNSVKNLLRIYKRFYLTKSDAKSYSNFKSESYNVMFHEMQCIILEFNLKTEGRTPLDHFITTVGTRTFTDRLNNDHGIDKNTGLAALPKYDIFDIYSMILKSLIYIIRYTTLEDYKKPIIH